MRRWAYLLGLVVIASSCVGGNSMAKDEPERSIQLALEGEEHSLGMPIKATVTYRNLSASNQTFREPEKDKDVRLGVFSGDEMVGEVRFGKMIRYMFEGKNRLTIEDADEVSIGPGEEYSFDYDLAGRWPDLFPPGRHQLKIVDYTTEEEGLFSNPVEAVVLYERESFLRLLEILRDEEAEVLAHEFASRWIGSLYPDFAFIAVEPTDEQSAESARQIQAAETWWESHKEDSSVAQRITEINEVALKDSEGDSPSPRKDPNE